MTNLIMKLLLMSLMIVPLIQAAHAGNTEMSEEQMQQMMEQAEKMQECIAKIDQSAIQSLTAKGEQMRSEVQALCAADKRDEAQNKAREYSKEIARSKELEEMKKCGEMAQQMMPQMPVPAGADGDTSASAHVCDGM